MPFPSDKSTVRTSDPSLRGKEGLRRRGALRDVGLSRMASVAKAEHEREATAQRRRHQLNADVVRLDVPELAERIAEAAFDLPTSSGGRMALVARAMMRGAMIRTHGDIAEAAELVGLPTDVFERRWFTLVRRSGGSR
jgi:hypothetical protein